MPAVKIGNNPGILLPLESTDECEEELICCRSDSASPMLAALWLSHMHSQLLLQENSGFYSAEEKST